jgi:hypothetical protein
MAGGKGWVVSKTVAPQTMPADARMKVIEFSKERLVVQTPNRLWWPGPCWLSAIAGMLIYFRGDLLGALRSDLPQGLGMIATAAGLAIVFIVITAFLSTHQWLCVGPHGLKYELRLGPRMLRRQHVPFGELQELLLGDLESGGCEFLGIRTKDWEVNFGNELVSEPIAYLISEIKNPSDCQPIPWPAGRGGWRGRDWRR